MKLALTRIGAGLVVLFLLLVFILPIGIKTGTEFVSFGSTPQIERDQNKKDGFTDDNYKTEVICKYFVRNRVESFHLWKYSELDTPNPPRCDVLTLYWHDGWLLSSGTVLF